MLAILFLLFGAEETCSTIGRGLLDHSQKSWGRKVKDHEQKKNYLKIIIIKWGSFETAIMRRLPKKCEHFTMYAFASCLLHKCQKTINVSQQVCQLISNLLNFGL